jgi:hypothetical protein
MSSTECSCRIGLPWAACTASALALISSAGSAAVSASASTGCIASRAASPLVRTRLGIEPLLLKFVFAIGLTLSLSAALVLAGNGILVKWASDGSSGCVRISFRQSKPAQKGLRSKCCGAKSSATQARERAAPRWYQSRDQRFVADGILTGETGAVETSGVKPAAAFTPQAAWRHSRSSRRHAAALL